MFESADAGSDGYSEMRLGGMVLGRLERLRRDDAAGEEETFHPGLRGALLFAQLTGAEIELDGLPVDADLASALQASGLKNLEELVSPSVIMTAADPRSGGAAVDAWFVTDRDLRLRFASPTGRGHRPATWRLYQRDVRTKRMILAGEASVGDAAIKFADFSLANQFMPALVCVLRDNVLVETSLLPFPSLCRGGAHYAELCAARKTPDSFSELRSYSAEILKFLVEGKAGSREFDIERIEVDVRGAIGSEPTT